MYSYPLWLASFVLAPIVGLWLANFGWLRRWLKPIGLAVVGAALFAAPWDYIAIRRRIWYFQKPHIVGLMLIGLPIEEWLFIALVTTLFATITLLVWRKFGVDPDVR